jgi:hypothetical protein
VKRMSRFAQEKCQFDPPSIADEFAIVAILSSLCVKISRSRDILTVKTKYLDETSSK